MSELNPRMLFEAGRVAGSRSWPSPLLIDVSAVESLEPAGSPLVILVHEAEMTAADSRTIAALMGAGREAVILSENGGSDDVAGWLPEGSVVRFHAVGPRAHQPSQTGTISVSQPYCDLHSEPPRWSEEPERVRPARYFWDGFREDSPYQVYEGRQGGTLVEWFAHLPIEGSATAATVRFIPTATAAGPCVVVEAAVGQAGVPAFDDKWLDGFADSALAYTEMPDSHTRLGSGVKDPRTLPDLRSASDSIWKDVPDTGRPTRVLRSVPNGQDWFVTLTYVVPVTEDFYSTRQCLLRCVDSLSRVRRLVQDPSTDLDGRRNPKAGVELIKLLNAVDLLPVRS